MTRFLDTFLPALAGPYGLAAAFIGLVGLFAYIAYKSITNSRKEDKQ